MDETILRLLEQLPLSAGVVLFMFWLGRRFMGIWERQVASRDHFLEKVLDRYASLDGKVDGIEEKMNMAATSMVSIAQAHTDSVLQLATQLKTLQQGVDSFSGRMIATMKQMDAVLGQWNKLTENSTAAVQELKAVHERELAEMKSKMDSIEEGNHSIYNELKGLNERLDRLIATLEAARIEEFARIPATIQACLKDVQATMERIEPPDPPAKPTRKTPGHT